MLFRIRKKLDGRRREPPDGLWLKCDNCSEILYRAQLEKNLWVCAMCNYHFRIRAEKYKEILLDDGEFEEEIGKNLESEDPLKFPDYREKLKESQKRTGMKDAAVGGVGLTENKRIVLFLMDFEFMGGSMGSVVGEKFIRTAQRAIEEKIPYIAVTTSGGARMQEGIISLMQLAKTTSLCVEMAEERIPYITILTHPTTAGVLASFASLGDIIIAEPGALIGFTGPRVIKDTIKQELPEGFQRSEFLKEHGLVDMVVSRTKLKDTVGKILDILS